MIHRNLIFYNKLYACLWFLWSCLFLKFLHVFKFDLYALHVIRSVIFTQWKPDSEMLINLLVNRVIIPTRSEARTCTEICFIPQDWFWKFICYLYVFMYNIIIFRKFYMYLLELITFFMLLVSCHVSYHNFRNIIGNNEILNIFLFML